MLCFLYLCSAISVSILVFSWWKNRHKRRLYNELKCDWKCWPIIGHAGYFIGSEEDNMNTLKALGKQSLRRGGPICIWQLNKLVYLTSDAADGEFLLSAYLEKDECLNVTHCIGINLIFSPLKFWRPRRKIIAKLFTSKRLQASARVHIKYGKVLAEQLKSIVGKHFSLWDYIASYSLNSIGETVLGTKLQVHKNNQHAFLDALVTNTEISGTRILQPWLQNESLFWFSSWFSSLYAKVMSTSQYLKDFVEQRVVEKHKLMKASEERLKNDPQEQESMIENLMLLYFEGKGFTQEDVRNETLGLALAAVDSTTVSVTCMLWLLARHPVVQDKLYDELIQYYGDSNKPASPEDYTHLKYLDVVIKETLRLFPPVPILVRQITDTQTLPSGRRLFPGMGAYIHVQAIHRNPKYWGEDAEVFRPERFFEEYDNSAYMPFGKGARSCLGNRYGQLSIKSAMVNVLRRYRFSAPPGSYEDLRLKFGVTAKTVEDHLVQVELRN